MDLTISDWIGIAGALTSTGLGVIALIQNAKYKKQSDEFVDLQFMPEIFPLTAIDKFPDIRTMQNKLMAQVKGSSGTFLRMGQYATQNSPIYNMNIDELWIDDKLLGKGAVQKSINIYPVNSDFNLEVCIPNKLIDDHLLHKGRLTLIYENQYSVMYVKELIFEFTGSSFSKKSQKRAKRRKKKWTN